MSVRRLIYLFFSLGLLALACRNERKIDVSHIDLNVHVERFDLEMDSLLRRPSLAAGTLRLYTRYGTFFHDYTANVLGTGKPGSPDYEKNITTILQTRDYTELRNDVVKKFATLQPADEQLTDAFRRLKYYYPQTKVPRVIGCITGFAYQTFIGEGYIGIGLDLFLGADSRFYPALRESIPGYLSRSYTPENIPPRAIEGYVREELLPERNDNASLLARMVYNGKVLYFMDQLLPDVADSLKIDYSSRQYDWARQFEKDTWAYFISENLLYETDYLKVQKYLNPAPFTPGIGAHNDSAPKLGVFTGWQIVKEYMEKHPDVTLQQLLAGKDDAQKILNGSGYRP